MKHINFILKSVVMFHEVFKECVSHSVDFSVLWALQEAQSL
jgi:hypothetical protein